MLPSRAFLTALLVPTALSVATVWQPDLLWPVVCLDALIFAVALIDLWRFKKAHIELALTGRDILSIRQQNRLDLELSVSGNRLLRATLRPDLPASFRCPELESSDGQYQELEVALRPGQPTRLTYHLIPTERGEWTLGDHYLRYPSPLLLWKRDVRLPSQRRVRVYPDLAMIRTYEMLARQHRQYALVRASRLRGGESEFARLRDYSSDDDYRFIDWKATARRNRLTTREYQLESDQNVFLILDSGRLMTGHVAGLSQFDWALNSALLMAHVATTGGDRVGLMCFDEEVRTFLLPQGGAKATSRLVQETYSQKPRLTESAFQKALTLFGTRMKQRSLVMIFTQLIDDSAVAELATELRRLSRTHLPLVILLEDTDLTDMAAAPQKSTGTARELYDRGAAAELLLWKSDVVHKLRKTGAHVIETRPSQLSNHLVNRYLEIKAQHAL